MHCMSSLYSKLLYKMGQDFLDRQQSKIILSDTVPLKCAWHALKPELPCKVHVDANDLDERPRYERPR